MKYIVLLGSLFLVPFFACAQTWKQLNDSLIHYYQKEEFKKADPFAEKAVAAAKNEFGEGHKNYATSLNNQGLIYIGTGQYAKAELLFLQSLAIRKKLFGEVHPDYALALTNLAELYQKQQEYKKAEPLYIQSMEIWRKGGGEEDLRFVSMMNNLAIFYQNTGQFEKAEPLYLQVKDTRKKLLGENHSLYASSLNNLALVYQGEGQYKKAEPLYAEALLIWKKNEGETKPDYLTCLNNLGALYQAMGNYEKAEPLFLETNKAWKKTLGDDHPDYAGGLNQLALLYKDMGEYGKSEILFLQAKQIWKKALGETHSHYAACLYNLASLYRATGEYEKAEPLFLQSITITKSTLGENHPDYAAVLNNLAILYQVIGQYEKAESLYIQAKEIRKKALGDNHPDYAASLNNLGALYHARGFNKKAEPLYLQAKQIREKTIGKNHPDYLASLNNLADVYENMGQYEKAEAFYIEAKEKWKIVLGENHPGYVVVLNNLAGLYKETGQYEKAETLYTQANETGKKNLGVNHPYYASGISNLAALYLAQGQYKKAEPLILQNSQLELQNLLNNFTILSENEKGNYINNKITLLETNNSFVYTYKEASSLILQNNFNQQLVFKSLTLSDTRKVLLSVQQSSDSSIQQLLKDWQTHKGILAKQYSLPIADRRADLKEIQVGAENMEKELGRRSSVILNQQKAVRISLQDIQKNLQQNEAAVEFVRFRLFDNKWTDSTIYAAYILQKNDPVPIFVPLCEEKQLQQLFDSAGNTATSMVNKFYRGVEIKNNNANTLGKELYKLVWQPLEPYLKGVKKISYSPAGKLYSIALHALPVDSTMVLMDKYQLQQYTSTRQVALRNAETKNTKPGSITLFGNASFTMDSLQLTKQKTNKPEKENVSTSIFTPQKRSSDNGTWNSLPGTAEEVKKIKQLFDQGKIASTSFIQTTATEENLKALSGNSPQILHIATHGFFLPEADKKRKENKLNNENTYSLADDPLLRSGLILAGGNYAWSGKTPIDGAEDGIATAYEISQLNLSNTELVVLSACETALGDVKGSEGVFGLQRAFKMAGVKKMIVSLWQVPDKETAELMIAFYTYWMQGKTINDAFTQAQADMRKKYSPFYWAAFVLVD